MAEELAQIPALISGSQTTTWSPIALLSDIDDGMEKFDIDNDAAFDLDQPSQSSKCHAPSERESDDLKAFQADRLADIQAHSSATPSTRTTPPAQAIKAISDREEMMAAAEGDKLRLRNVASTSEDESLRNWSSIFAKTFQIYQDQAASTPKKKPAPSHGIDFGSFKDTSCTATLLDVIQLLPEAYQAQVRAADGERAGTPYKSWLKDHIVDAVIRLSSPLASDSVIFGRGIGTGFSKALDGYYEQTKGMPYLEYVFQQAKGGKWTPEERNPGKVFTFPSTTKIIVFLWNYTEAHWVLVKLEIDEIRWKYYLYNSDGQREKGQHGIVWYSRCHFSSR